MSATLSRTGRRNLKIGGCKNNNSNSCSSSKTWEVKPVLIDMDAKEDQVATPPHLPPSSPVTTYSLPKIKLRKSAGTKIKLTQIHEKPVEPEYKTQLVLYDKSGESRSHKQKKGVVNEFNDNAEAKSSSMERAEEFRANLDAAFPSFAKALVRSNVTVGFWMHLPMRFCKSYLPKNDATIFLENENGEEYITNYIAERTALSGGWKAFCAANKLVEGDVLIFHLVKPLRFKVYVVSGSGSAKVNEEFGIQNIDTRGKQVNSDPDEKEMKGHKKVKHLEIVPVSCLQENNQENSLIVVDANKGRVANQSENDSEDRSSETMEIIRSSGSTFDFKDIESIEDFNILVTGLAVDSEFSNHHRTKYYELCCSQNSFLHENLLNSINHKLAAEIIIGTVNISEAIRSSMLSSLHTDYAIWDKTLKGFELLGMNVGFLRTRLSRLMSLAMESEEAMESECREARLEQARVNEEMQSLELKLLKLKQTRQRLDAEIEALKANAEKHELMFQEVVNAPW